jgi:DNA-binding phage protein
MSRASWYQHGKPATKPKRKTRAAIAAEAGVSLRTLYRALKKRREEQVASDEQLAKTMNPQGKPPGD